MKSHSSQVSIHILSTILSKFPEIQQKKMLWYNNLSISATCKNILVFCVQYFNIKIKKFQCILCANWKCAQKLLNINKLQVSFFVNEPNYSCKSDVIVNHTVFTACIHVSDSVTYIQGRRIHRHFWMFDQSCPSRHHCLHPRRYHRHCCCREELQSGGEEFEKLHLHSKKTHTNHWDTNRKHLNMSLLR